VGKVGWLVCELEVGVSIVISVYTKSRACRRHGTRAGEAFYSSQLHYVIHGGATKVNGNNNGIEEGRRDR